MPWNSVRIGDRNLSTALRAHHQQRQHAADDEGAGQARRECATPSPARRQNIAPSEKISMQRQNTSISDGNRKRGKNSEANCQSTITTTNGNTDVPAVSLSPAARSTSAADDRGLGRRSLISRRLIDRRGDGSDGQEGDRFAGRIDRVDLLAHVGRPSARSCRAGHWRGSAPRSPSGRRAFPSARSVWTPLRDAPPPIRRLPCRPRYSFGISFWFFSAQSTCAATPR